MVVAGRLGPLDVTFTPAAFKRGKDSGRIVARLVQHAHAVVEGGLGARVDVGDRGIGGPLVGADAQGRDEKRRHSARRAPFAPPQEEDDHQQCEEDHQPAGQGGDDKST